MRRQDFIDDITTWSELLSFCYDEDCDICEDIYSEDSRDEDIDTNNLVEWARNNTWQELHDILEEIPTGYDYYCRDDYGDWFGADNDLFEDRKQEVIDWMDDGGYWDEEYEDEEDVYLDNDYEEDVCPDNDYEEEEDLEPVEPESISFTDLFTSCNNKLEKIEDIQEKEAQEEDKRFDSFVMSFAITEERR